ncbi:MAG: transaldolase [Deltaproteobacteria bacterium]|nr:transaldolase [Deltaproteobacteria bacterium]
MEKKNLLEKLVEVSPGMEIWWDSSPVIYNNWCRKVLDKAAPENREIIQGQLDRMYDESSPETQLFRGVTTNPPLSLQAIQDDPPYWEGVTKTIVAENPGIDTESLFWSLYRQVVKRGSDMYLPLFEKSGYKEGYLSGQTDPRSAFDKDAMMKQALDIAAINPNVMIKVPGTKEGYDVIEELTARGIATNNTLTFILPQLVDCAESVKRGLQTAQKNGVDLSKWRSVITHMESRYGDLGGLRDAAAEEGIELTDGDVRLAELAIFKKAYKYLEDNNLPSKMLSCSLRFGPTVEGKTRIWHLEEKTGAAVVMTCPPSFIDQVMNFENEKDIVFEADRIHAETPKDVLDKLMRIPYFEKAYAVDGYTRDEYNTHPALQRTAAQFSKATEEMVAFAAKCL